MTKEEIDDFNESLSQSLFHVMSGDKDDETGASLEEVILIQHLAGKPEMLKHKPLKDWVDEIVGKCHSEAIKMRNDDVMQRQNNRKIKPHWAKYEVFMKSITDRYISMLTYNSAEPIEERDVPDYKIIDGQIVFNVKFNNDGSAYFETIDRCPREMDGVIRTPKYVVEEWVKLKNASALIWLNKNALTYEQFLEEYVDKSCKTCVHRISAHGTCYCPCNYCKDRNKYEYDNFLKTF